MNLGIFIGIILIIILFLFSYCACIISGRYSKLEEEEEVMSILQEYEEIEQIIGVGRIRAIDKYIQHCSKNGKEILYSDIIYKEKEYELFDKWFQEEIEPFEITDLDSCYSVTLWQDFFDYDWVEEKKIKPNKYGDGHCYNDLFEEYLDKNFPDLNKKLKYDSENGMFCVYCKDVKTAEEVIYELAKLYKDEDKMIELIKEYKTSRDIEFCI